MKKITSVAAALVLAAGQAAAQPQATPLVPMLQQQDQILFNAVNARAKVPEAPISEAPAGKHYDVNANFTLVQANSGEAYTADYSGRVSEIIEGDDGYVYVKNIPVLLGAQSYVQAERGENDTIIVRKQIVYASYGYEYYLTIAKWDANSASVVEQPDASVKLIYKDGTLRSIDKDTNYETATLLAYTYGNETAGFTFGGRGEFNLNYYPNTDEVVELPAGLETESFVMKSIDSYTTEDAFQRINIAITDTEVYLNVYEDAYVKGTIDGDKVTFKSGQFLGNNSLYGYSFYFIAGYVDNIYDDEGNFERYQAMMADELVFDYDKENRTLKTDGIYLINAGKESMMALSVAWAPEIYPFVEVAAIPADPSITSYTDVLDTYGYNYAMFSIPTCDTEGNYIDIDKLSYKVYVDDEPFIFSPDEYDGLAGDMEEVPYGFRNDGGQISTSYFMLFFFPEKNVGMQTIYYGGGEVHHSNIVFLDINTKEVTVVADPDTLTGIESVAEQDVVSVSFADISGRAVNASAKGLVLMTVKRADGTQKTIKTVLK